MREDLIRNSLRQSKPYIWFKRVFLHDKLATFLYQQNKLNKKFNQYYKFLNSLKNYDLISIKEASISWQEIRKQHVEEHKNLIKSFWPEEYKNYLNSTH